MYICINVGAFIFSPYIDSADSFNNIKFYYFKKYTPQKQIVIV